MDDDLEESDEEFEENPIVKMVGSEINEIVWTSQQYDTCKEDERKRFEAWITGKINSNNDLLY